jgi:hypothetical protein
MLILLLFCFVAACCPWATVWVGCGGMGGRGSTREWAAATEYRAAQYKVRGVRGVPPRRGEGGYEASCLLSCFPLCCPSLLFPLPLQQQADQLRPCQNRRIVAPNIHSMSLMIGSSRLQQGLARQQHADAISPSGLLLPRQLARQQQQQLVQLPTLQQKSSHSRQVGPWLVCITNSAAAPQITQQQRRETAGPGCLIALFSSHPFCLCSLRPTVAAHRLGKGTHIIATAVAAVAAPH